MGIAAINPFRYRGYYYDAEIGMYYLQSRYYNPAVGIFVNADAAMFAIVGNGILEHNLFAYCKNEPVKNSDPSGHWTEYWGTFNATAINNFSAKLDNRAESIRKKFWWVKWAGFALGIIVGIITGFFLSPIGGAVVGAGVSLATMGIEKLIDLYPSELNSISRSVRNGYNAIKRSLIIYFLFGSHSNQIKIVNSSTKKTYSKISIRTNAIGDLVAYAKNSGVKISSKTVSWKYSY